MLYIMEQNRASVVALEVGFESRPTSQFRAGVRELTPALLHALEFRPNHGSQLMSGKLDVQLDMVAFIRYSQT
jgi:hypothetical protein